jgi:hypothetical protein
MKLKLDLIKSILSEIEDDDEWSGHFGLKIDGYDDKEVTYHLFLLDEAGLICGVNESTLSERIYSVESLTWAGHEFLANAREPEVWNAAKEIAGHTSFTVFISTLTNLALDHGLGSLKSWLTATLERLGGS